MKLFRGFKCIGINDEDEDKEVNLPTSWKSQEEKDLFQFKYISKKEGKIYAS